VTAEPQWPPTPQPGPPTPPAGPGPEEVDPGGRRGRWRTVVLVMVTVLAVAASASAGVGSWLAAARAGEAAEQAKRAADLVAAGAPAGGRPQPPPGPADRPAPAAEPTGEPTGEAAPVDPNATGEPRLDERTTYEPKYQKEPLTLSAECQRYMYNDLDEPRADVGAEGFDIAFEGGCSAVDPPVIRLGDGVAASSAGSRDSSPADCVEKIRQSPVGGQLRIPARQGAVICLNTSFRAAQERGDQWRIVRLEVVSADLNTARIEAYAWNVR